MYFFLGWLVCLTILVAQKYWPKTATVKKEKDSFTYLPITEGITDTVSIKLVKPKAEFLKSTRVEEITKGKKDLKLDDILT